MPHIFQRELSALLWPFQCPETWFIGQSPSVLFIAITRKRKCWSGWYICTKHNQREVFDGTTIEQMTNCLPLGYTGTHPGKEYNRVQVTKSLGQIMENEKWTSFETISRGEKTSLPVTKDTKSTNLTYKRKVVFWNSLSFGQTESVWIAPWIDPYGLPRETSQWIGKQNSHMSQCGIRIPLIII